MRLDTPIFNILRLSYSTSCYDVCENREILYYDLTDLVKKVEKNNNLSVKPSYYLRMKLILS